jgi:hypothetical protein
MENSEVMNLLEKDFNNYLNEYENLNNQFAPLIKNKIIGNRYLYNIRDYEEETFGFHKGNEIKKLPQNTRDVKIYYFDESKRIIMIDNYGSNKNIIDREYCFYENTALKTVYYSGGFIRLRNVTLSLNNNGKTEKVYNYGKTGVSIKEYMRNENILEKIKVQNKKHGENDYTNYELLFEFKNNELIKILQEYPNGYKKEIYR